MEHKLLEDLRTQLEMWRSYGVEVTARPPRGSDPDGSRGSAIAASWEELRQCVHECRKCEELAKGRTNVVFGTGDPKAKLVFVGEAPGYEEDLQGKPFVGRAGELLTKMIQAMGFTRDQVYILNVLKCRPPGNRNPLPDEIEHCEPYLKRQLELLRPRVLVALGKFAAQTLLATERPISQLRGKFHEYQGIPLMPTYHPAYLLRNPSDKKFVWEDLKQALAALERPPS